MIFVEIRGGLGDQLFQYAFARYIRLETSRRVSIFWYWKEAEQPMPFVLDKYAIQLPTLPTGQVRRFIRRQRKSFLFGNLLPSFQVCREVRTFPHQMIEYQLIKDVRHVVYKGNWRSALIVNRLRDILLDDLQLICLPSKKSRQLAATIKSAHHPTALYIQTGQSEGWDRIASREQISRGSYSESMLSASYYAKALWQVQHKLNRLTLFVFTDDIKMAASLLAKIPMRNHIVYVDPVDHANWEYLFLMQQCQHFILSNSSSAWWGCWLARQISSKTSMTVMPANWLGYEPGEITSRRLQIAANTVQIANVL